jgi:hypothetical protein
MLVGVSNGSAQSDVPAGSPIVSIVVTTPDGRVHDLTAHESGLATVHVAERDYGFRPTMHDDRGRAITISVFRMGNSAEATQEIADVDLTGGAAAVATRSTPAFSIRAAKAAPGQGRATTNR